MQHEFGLQMFMSQRLWYWISWLWLNSCIFRKVWTVSIFKMKAVASVLLCSVPCLCAWQTVPADPAVGTNLALCSDEYLHMDTLSLAKKRWRKVGADGASQDLSEEPPHLHPTPRICFWLLWTTPPKSPPLHMAALLNWSHLRSLRGAGSARLSRLWGSPDLSLNTASWHTNTKHCCFVLHHLLVIKNLKVPFIAHVWSLNPGVWCLWAPCSMKSMLLLGSSGIKTMCSHSTCLGSACFSVFPHGRFQVSWS